MGGITILLALLVLGFLIFIHELGHYFMARKAGMRVDVFSIGFGPTILKWRWQDVDWQLSLLPFGGYVKIAGMYEEEGDPRQQADGFYGKGPLARILVAVMGPLVNLVFALLLFSALFAMGGRVKDFSQYSHRIGWVDPQSELYAEGVRPGDILLSYEGREIKSARDHLIAPMISDPKFDVRGIHMDERSGEEEAFSHTVAKYPHPSSLDNGIVTSGILASAGYVIYDAEAMALDPTGKIAPSASLAASGMQSGDRIVWVDGQIIYSRQQLEALLNEQKALFTVERAGKIITRRVPRIRLMDFLLTPAQREELTDWQFDMALRDTELKQLLFVPYNLTNKGIVEGALEFLDEEDKKAALPERPFSETESALQRGDLILAVDGVPVTNSEEIFKLLQDHKIHAIVERGADYNTPVTIEDADTNFNASIDWKTLNGLAAALADPGAAREAGALHLLKPIKPVTQRELLKDKKDRVKYDELIKEQRTRVLSELTGERQKKALSALDEATSRLFLGIPAVKDRKVIYNPGPFEAFGNLLSETFETLRALFSGYLSPKWLAGPVGIVQVIHQQWSVGLADVLFLMAFISQQLGLLNLMPIPVLDGGHICFALWEWATGRQVGQKTMERLTIPFYFLLIGLAVFLTYHDVLRLFQSIFGGF